MRIDFSKKQAQIVKASKQLVDDLLDMNTENRTVKKSHLTWIKQAIDRQDFVLTPQGVGISTEGKLIDGQHRLLAIKEAGYPPVEFLLVSGIDPKARVYIDQNAKRSTADMLKIVLNQEVSNRMAAVVNTHLKIFEGSDGFTMGKSLNKKPLLDDVVETMQEYIEWLALLHDASGPLARAGVLCGYFHYAMKHDLDAALELAESVKNGERLTKNKPAYRLREYLLGNTRRTTYGNSGQLADYKNTVTACVAHSNGEELNSLRPANSWEGLAPKVNASRHTMKAKNVRARPSEDLGRSSNVAAA